jgi:hypothetical protein
MKIEIDTKEDLHNLRHIIQLLHAISGSVGAKKYGYDSSPSLFTDATPSHTPQPTAETSASMFNMFDSSGSSSSSSSSDPLGIPSIFQEQPKKDDNNQKDFLESLQVY